MSRNRFPSHAVRYAAFACVLALGGCTTWYETMTPMPSANQVLHSPLRVTRHDGFSMVIDNAVVHGDTVYGNEHGNLAQPRAVALHDVKRMEGQAVDPVNSALVGAGAALAAFGAFMLMVIYELGTEST